MPRDPCGSDNSITDVLLRRMAFQASSPTSPHTLELVELYRWVRNAHCALDFQALYMREQGPPLSLPMAITTRNSHVLHEIDSVFQ